MSILPLTPPLLIPVEQPQELVHVVQQFEELVDESHGHSGSSVISVWAATTLAARLWLQIRMRDLARQADADSTVLPPLYWRYAWTWAALGVPAFVSVLVIFYLMVAKPA